MSENPRNDPYDHPDSDPKRLLEVGTTYLRFMGAGMGLVLIICGLCLAFSVFGLIRGLIANPDSLTTYLDNWERTPVEIESATEQDTSELTDAPQEDTESAAQAGEAGNQGTTVNNFPRGRRPGGPANRRAGQPTRTTRSQNQWMDSFKEFTAAVRDGGMARTIGALFIFLLAWLLLKIPFMLIRMGIQMMKSFLGQKEQKGSGKTYV